MTLAMVETVEAVEATLTGDAAMESFFIDHCEINSMGKGKISEEFFAEVRKFKVWR